MRRLLIINLSAVGGWKRSVPQHLTEELNILINTINIKKEKTIGNLPKGIILVLWKA
jgi:hypothetical protein